MKNQKAFRYLTDWLAVWVAVFSFEVLAAVAVDPQLNVDQDAWQALIRAVLIATGATGMWQAISWARGSKNIPEFVQDQLPVSPPVGTGQSFKPSNGGSRGGQEEVE